MSKSRKQLGDWGERLAADYLVEHGYELMQRNWRCSRGEIDLIMRYEDATIFVEVKTRRGQSMGTPEEGLSIKKGNRIVEIAQIYLAENDLDVDWQIDLVAVELDLSGKMVRFEHIPNAILGW